MMRTIKSPRSHPVLSELETRTSHESYSDIWVKGSSGNKIPTHRFILSTVSPVLSSVLHAIPLVPDACLVIPDSPGQTVLLLLEFIYCGKLRCSELHYHRLIELMQMLDIDYMTNCNVICEFSDAPLQPKPKPHLQTNHHQPQQYQQQQQQYRFGGRPSAHTMAGAFNQSPQTCQQQQQQQQHHYQQGPLTKALAPVLDGVKADPDEPASYMVTSSSVARYPQQQQPLQPQFDYNSTATSDGQYNNVKSEPGSSVAPSQNNYYGAGGSSSTGSAEMKNEPSSTSNGFDDYSGSRYGNSSADYQTDRFIGSFLGGGGGSTAAADDFTASNSNNAVDTDAVGSSAGNGAVGVGMVVGSSDQSMADLMMSCQFCEKCFTSAEHLDNHVRLKHSSGSYKCYQCDYSTNSRSHLNRHLKTFHEKEKNYVCETCDKKFSLKYSLTRHRAMVHLRLRPHGCALCESFFASKEQLERHMRTHTGEKPYACGQCGKSFAAQQALRNHEASAHADDGSGGTAGKEASAATDDGNSNSQSMLDTSIGSGSESSMQ